MKRIRLLSVAVGLSLAAGIGFASNPADAQSRLDNIKRDKKIVVGARESTPPYGYTNKDGKWVGFSIDLGRSLTQIIGKKLGMELAYEMKPVTPQTRIPLIVNGTVDAYFGSAGKSVERDDVVDFSHITNAVCVKKLVAKSSAIRSTNDLAGKRVGVTKGSLEERTLVAMNAKGELKPPVKVVPFDKHSTGFIALSQGKTDAHVTMDDALIALSMASPNPADWDVRGPDIFCT
ncbi:MAG: transporter substrate-binding domain-containing protein, partial [Proteobacteria bacterium]|nr:transporter substrate-binding domain-containing protein [Pseudomonadota bacterium]